MIDTVFSNNIGKTASFKVFPSIIKDDFTNVKILGVVSYEDAEGFGVAETHVKVYPTLPAGTPNDYRAYNYLKLRFPNGKVDVIGLPWVEENSVRIFSTMDIVITIRNKGVEDIDTLRMILAANGYQDVSIATNAK